MSTFDYTKLIGPINAKVRTYLAQLLPDANKNDLLAPENGAGAQPAYPFTTWDIDNLHNDLGFTDNVDYEEFEMSLVYTIHTDNVMQAANLGEALRKLFYTHDMYMLGVRNGFYFIDTSDVESADNLISIQVEHRMSFTVNIRVKDSFVDNKPSVGDVEINGYPLSSKQKYKEGK